MSAIELIMDELVDVVASDATLVELRCHLAELLLADGHDGGARRLALAGLVANPHDVRLLRVVLDSAVTVDDLVTIWTNSPAPAEH